MDKIPVIVIVGPTASGKTKLSVELAKHFKTEIVSADSMQIYKNMDIATAKPTISEKQDIVHHMMDFISTDKEYSVADYVSDAHKILVDIYSRNMIPIVVGGTGLYIDSLLSNVKFTDAPTDIQLRNELNDIYINNGIDYLLNCIKEFDYDSYNRLKIERNPKRIIRCIEVYRITGKTQTEINRLSLSDESPYFPIMIGLSVRDREFLYDRINKRVDKMIDDGLVEEAKNFYCSENSCTSAMAIGYKELHPYLFKDVSLDDCIEELKKQTRHYAKRQLTWFRKNDKINWFNIDELSFDDILKQSILLIEESLNG